MKKVSFLVGVVMGALMLFPAKVWSQTCPNLNFSMGNLTYWQCYFGGCSGQNYYATKSAQIPGNIDVLSKAVLDKAGQLYDEKCNKIKKVPEGYSFSCRIGNSVTGAQVDGIEYTMKVDSMNSLLILSFAWVMENPGHSLPEQPQFRMILRDTLGRTLDKIPCSYVQFTAQANMDHLACDNGTLVARDWVTTAFSLEGLMGQTIKIYFETWDCTQSGHYGYAYIVGECRPMRIEMAYCAGMPSVKLTAPEGFDIYEWTRSSMPTWKLLDRIIVVPSPLDNEIFTVTVRNELGCESQLKTKIEKTTVVPEFLFGVAEYRNGEKIVDFIGQKGSWISWYDTCNRTATFVNRSHVVNSKLDFIRWEILGLNINSRDSLFTYTFPDPITAPKTYLVRLTAFATNGCADTSKPTAHLITIYPSPRIIINGPKELCEGLIDTLKATPLRSTFAVKDYTWSWVKKDGTKGSLKGVEKLVIDGPGTYYLEAIDSVFCVVRDTFIVTPLKLKMDITTKEVTCWGMSDGSFSHGKITGGSGTFTIAVWERWDNVNQKKIYDTVTGSALLGLDFKNQKAGAYAFYAKDDKRCEIFDTIYILQPDSLELFPIVRKTTCGWDNGRIVFKENQIIGTDTVMTYMAKGGTKKSGTGVHSPYDFTVTLLNGKDSLMPPRRDSITDLPVGVYKTKVVDAKGCVTDSVYVEILASPSPTLVLDTIIDATCGNDNGSIQLSAYYIIGNDTAYAPGPTNYKWTPQKNSIGKPNDANGIGYLKPGEYQLELTDGNGCPASGSYTVGAFPQPTMTYTKKPEICGRKNGEIRVTVTSASPDSVRYQWTKVSDTTAFSTEDTITNMIAGTYRLLITDAFCEIDTTIVIPHIDGPKANFIANTYTVPTSTIFTLTDDTKGTPKIWDWDMGDGNAQTGRIVRYSYEATGDYFVFLEVKDENGCIDTITKKIHVYDELHVYIPNMFTPGNGDKLNDTWRPIILENAKEGYQLAVYDRWGQRVFFTIDPEAAWDGTIDGKPAQNNTTYSYRLVVRDYTGQEFEYVGHVSIMR